MADVESAVTRIVGKIPAYVAGQRRLIPEVGSGPPRPAAPETPAPAPEEGLEAWQRLFETTGKRYRGTPKVEEYISWLERRNKTLEREAARERMRRLRVETAAGVGHEHAYRRRHPVLPEDQHWCSGCQRGKPRAEFYHDRSRPSGLAGYCIPCHKERCHAGYIKHREVLRAERAALRERIASIEASEGSERYGDPEPG